ncbi:unnamed protein product [Hyaloperonospora brassicae]|uniref:Cysteine-rich protein n=1 Tax=Hyaloperonospora brassicae TaxID=162125 RepID=A0AAV0TZ87_HYABA|nr:unnamed protein product [Hyaloperonospora brassicae]
MPSLLVVSAMLAAAASAVSVNIKVHSSLAMKFREVTVIKDNAVCPNGGDVLMCESLSYECQDDGKGGRACLERDDSFLDAVDNNTAIYWAECGVVDKSKPTKCLQPFDCSCNDDANSKCFCKPPDAWRAHRGVAKTCVTSKGKENACDSGKYCRTHDDKQECAPMPYPPTLTTLYSDCTNDKKCDEDLTCKAFDSFSMCLENKEKQS